MGAIRFRKYRTLVHISRHSCVRCPSSAVCSRPYYAGVCLHHYLYRSEKGVSSYIGEGSNRWGAVHRLDAAHLIRLAMERGPGGARYHGVGEEGIPLRDIASTIGRHLKMPVQSISAKKAVKHFSWLSTFVSADNPVSSKWTQEQLGWQPKHPGLISDLDRAEYRNVR